MGVGENGGFLALRGIVQASIEGAFKLPVREDFAGEDGRQERRYFPAYTAKTLRLSSFDHSIG